VRIELRTSPGCPHADSARRLVRACLVDLGIDDVAIIEIVGQYASPTVLVDGVDVMRPEGTHLCDSVCRLDVPTPQRVLAALRASANPRTPRSSPPC